MIFLGMLGGASDSDSCTKATSDGCKITPGGKSRVATGTVTTVSLMSSAGIGIPSVDLYQLFFGWQAVRVVIKNRMAKILTAGNSSTSAVLNSNC